MAAGLLCVGLEAEVPLQAQQRLLRAAGFGPAYTLPTSCRCHVTVGLAARTAHPAPMPTKPETSSPRSRACKVHRPNCEGAGQSPKNTLDETPPASLAAHPISTFSRFRPLKQPWSLQPRLSVNGACIGRTWLTPCHSIASYFRHLLTVSDHQILGNEKKLLDGRSLKVHLSSSRLLASIGSGDGP